MIVIIQKTNRQVNKLILCYHSFFTFHDEALPHPASPDRTSLLLGVLRLVHCQGGQGAERQDSCCT